MNKHPRCAFRDAGLLLLTAVVTACKPPTAVDDGAGGGALDLDLSRNRADLAASVPEVAIDPRDSRRVVVVWRTIAMTVEPEYSSRRAICHMSLSTDAGATFTHTALDWGLRDTPQCNAPFVDFGSDGDIFIGATLAARAPLNPPAGFHPFGRAVIRKSEDGGRTWSPTVSVIATDSGDKFAANPAVPEAAKRTPWDGARGAVDRRSGAIYVSGGYPAPPGGDAHSQRFYSMSPDGGKTWNAIHAIGSLQWPQRWDSRIVAAHGGMALTYVAAATPEVQDCLCIVFATSTDDGVTLNRTLVTRVQHVDMLVHYPPLAAHPSSRGNFAIALISDDRTGLTLFTTSDSGKRWKTLSPIEMPASVIRISRPAIAYSPGGMLVLMWRGEHSDASFDTYVAGSSDGWSFGAAQRISSKSSQIPGRLSSDYAARGDFINSVKVDSKFVHAAWTDWRTGTEARVYYGRMPLASLLGAQR